MNSATTNQRNVNASFAFSTVPIGINITDADGYSCRVLLTTEINHVELKKSSKLAHTTLFLYSKLSIEILLHCECRACQPVSQPAALARYSQVFHPQKQ